MRRFAVCFAATVVIAADAWAQLPPGPVLPGPVLYGSNYQTPSATTEPAGTELHLPTPVPAGSNGNGRQPYEVVMDSAAGPVPVPAPAAPWRASRGPADAAAFFPDPGSCICPGGVPAPLFWGSAEYLLAWVKGAPLGPPLATGSRIDPFLNLVRAGGLTDPNTEVLLGASDAEYGAKSGVRFAGRINLCGCMGIEGSAMILGIYQESESVGSNERGVPFILRPFYNVATGNPDAGYIIAIEDNFAGSVTVHAETQLWSADANLSWNVCEGNLGFLTLLAGYRHVDLREDLLITSPSQLIQPFGSFTYPGAGGILLGPGDLITVDDNFSCRNRFNGAQIGVRGEAQFGRFAVTGTAKVAFGVNNQQSIIFGSSSASNFEGRQLVDFVAIPSGLLAVGSNIGRYSKNVVSAVPELNIQIGYLCSARWRAFLGYNLLFWPNIIRPGDQISTFLNDVQTPLSPAFGLPGNGIPAPTVPFKESSFWAQGISWGLEYRY